MPATRARLGLPALTAAAAALVLLFTAAPAAADHTEPSSPLSSLSPALPGTPVRSQGAWQFVKNLPPNPGTDLKFFTRDGAVFAVAGSLGQNGVQYAGQRIVQLTQADGTVDVQWVADHGSARCTPSRAVTGLQHDTVVTPPADAELLLDTTDANDRCHDPSSGGLEIVDISGVGRGADGAPVKEIHLVRHDGTSHTATLDATRPWIVYNSNSDQDRPWIDVVDIRTCLGLPGLSLEQKRERCRPSVFRIPFDPTWTMQIDPQSNTKKAPHGCHDITARPGRLYCAAINGTLVLDVSKLTLGNGNVRGTPLPCEVVDGTGTGAKVTDCDLGGTTTAADRTAWEEAGKPAATGWSYVTHINHPGRDATNGQALVRSDDGVSISHESDPSPDGRFLFVTDERGGGVVPPGSSCAPGPGNPIGNGGMHVFDISDPAKPEYARTPDGKKAVFISHNVLPEPTFCNIHVIEQIPDEARLVIAWYSQGIKIVDYTVDDKGAWTFTEVGFITLPNAQTWTAEVFKTDENADGSRTYHIMASDIGRGIDVLTFTAPPNPLTVSGRGRGPGENVNPNANADDTRVLGTEASRGFSGSLAATGGTSPVELGALLLGAVLVLRLLARRRASHAGT